LKLVETSKRESSAVLYAGKNSSPLGKGGKEKASKVKRYHP